MKIVVKAICCGLVIAMMLSMTGFCGACEDIRKEVFRLHILANSDSEEDQELDNDYGYEEAYARLSFEDIVKKADQLSGDEDDEDEDDYDYDYDNNDNDNDNDNNDDDDEPVTSTVTTEITEETTKYFVNGSPVEQSVYEEFLSTWAARFSVWNAWESV